MRFPVLLAFLITALVVKSSSSVPTKVTFPPKLLKNDLDAFLKYFQKSDKNIAAYIHWPKSITFRVRMIEENTTKKKCLQIDGEFRYKKFKVVTESYKSLYYKDGQFYAGEKEGAPLKLISKIKPLSYIQPNIQERKPYISIRYFDFEQMQKEISAFYDAHKLHFRNVLEDYPATFLISNEDGHFLEYMFRSKNRFPQASDGLLRLLIGKGGVNRVRLTETDVKSRMVFDQRSNTLTIPEAYDIHSTPVPNVFGVRMNIRAFVAEAKGDEVKMLDAYDLNNGNSLPERHFVSGNDLLQKVKNVEPRLSYGNKMFSKLELPKRVKFQVKGSILVKSINYENNGEINKDCPFLLEYERKEKMFEFKGKDVPRICTNDTKLWGE